MGLAGMMLALLGGAALAAEAPVSWWTRYAAPANQVPLPDGRKLNLYCEGKGSPTVVMDAGLGDNASSWRGVQDPIAQTTRVCAYDRAGLGLSTFDPGKRDTRAMADDLAAALKAAHVKGPYVLVGHSAAGLTVRLYASLHRKDVVGLVLVDPSVEDQIARMGAVSPKFAAAGKAGFEAMRPCTVDPRPEAFVRACTAGRPADMPTDLADLYAGTRSPNAYKTILAEGQAFQDVDSQEVIAARAPLGELPLVILTATKHPAPGVPDDEAAAVETVWNTMHDEVATLSTRGENRRVEGAGHYVHRDRPELVVAAVVEVVTAARAGHKK